MHKPPVFSPRNIEVQQHNPAQPGGVSHTRR